MSLLTICQNAATEIGFPSMSGIMGSNDPVARQLLRLANREGESLAQANDWKVMTEEHTFTLATGTQSYDMPAGFRYIIPNTTWDRSDKRIVINPVTSERWQYLKGWTSITGLHRRARIRAGKLEFEQTITAADNGKTIAFEYISSYWAQSSAGTPQRFFTADTDVARLDEELITWGVVWRLLKAKGLDWETDYMEQQRMMRTQMARDGGARTLSLGGKSSSILGVNVNDRDFG